MKKSVDWKRWEATRKMGRPYFVLLVGGIGWGLSAALLFSILVYAFVSGVEFKSVLGSSLMIFPVAGIFWGLSAWQRSEREYARYKKSPDA
jgi:hypothetical protein